MFLQPYLHRHPVTSRQQCTPAAPAVHQTPPAAASAAAAAKHTCTAAVHYRLIRSFNRTSSCTSHIQLLSKQPLHPGSCAAISSSSNSRRRTRVLHRSRSSSSSSSAPRRIVPVMVEGHQCHRVGHAHRRLLLGKAFTATSPNGRFAEGVYLVTGSCCVAALPRLLGACMHACLCRGSPHLVLW